MGQWSHGTAHTYLGGAAGHDFTKYFKLLSPLKLADELRAQVGDELGASNLDDRVIIGGTPRSRSKAGPQRFGLESYMSMSTIKGGWGGSNMQ
ncbi:hypothetical protein PG985_006656 [Apiospora marii]|uniref:Uncharacterized protein n=1 Tax=Apiospora marii TaxID=335849 RepID=A0ABR1SAI2_9PEZI